MVLTSVQKLWLLRHYDLDAKLHLSKQLGFSLTKSGLWTAVTVCGMMAGIWIFSRLADRIGRKPSFLLFQLGAVDQYHYLLSINRANRDVGGWRILRNVRKRYDGRLWRVNG